MARSIPTPDLMQGQYQDVAVNAGRMVFTASFIMLLAFMIGGIVVVNLFWSRSPEGAKVVMGSLTILVGAGFFTMMFLLKRVERLAADLGDTANLLVELGTLEPNTPLKALARRAFRLGQKFERQRSMLEVDPADMVGRKEYAELEIDIVSGKSKFWRLRDTAVRWGMLGAEANSIKGFAELLPKVDPTYATEEPLP